MSDPGKAIITAVGFSHPPDIVPLQRRPGGPVEWHKVECSAITEKYGKCSLGLQTGCAKAPAPEEYA